MTVLVPMHSDHFQAYAEAAVAGYAQDNVSAGRWPATGALERSRADFESLLPQGPDTPGHFFYEILADARGPVVGFLWLAVERRHGAVSAYVYDVEVLPVHRRRGHALRALQAAESIAIAAGATAIGLNVFADNGAAQALYRKLGYRPTNFNMRKNLEPNRGSPSP